MKKKPATMPSSQFPDPMHPVPPELEKKIRKKLKIAGHQKLEFTPTLFEADAFYYKRYIRLTSWFDPECDLEPALNVEMVMDIEALTGDKEIWHDAFVQDLEEGQSKHLPALFQSLINQATESSSEARLEVFDQGPREGIGCDDCGDKRPGWIELLSKWVPCDCNPDGIE